MISPELQFLELINYVYVKMLHFDHGSGAFKRQPGKIVKRFTNARYHVLKAHYEYAIKPLTQSDIGQNYDVDDEGFS